MSLMNEVYLGIDGGGTKTDVILVDANSKIIGQGTSGPTNLTSTNVGAASFNLKEAVRQALEKAPPGSEITGNGSSTAQEYEMAYQPFNEILSAFGVKKFVLVHDSIIALENGSSNPNAVVLIAGTGSICVGRNEHGETAKAGGMDYLLTDQGSGYDIGRHVLREAVKSYDGRRNKTILEELVCQHFGIETLENLKMSVYHPPLSKFEIAELSKLCSEAFSKGDTAAAQIFEWALTEQIRLIQAVLQRLNIMHKPADLVLTGSITQLEPIKGWLHQRLQSQHPLLQVISPETPATHGAAQVALHHADETL